MMNAHPARLGSIAIAVCILLLGATERAAAQIKGTQDASGFTTPVAFIQDPTDRTVQFVVQQNGRIRVVRNGTVLAADFLNLTGQIISGGEQGLLGMALAPDYAASGRFFVNFTNPAGDTVVARFKRSAANVLVADVELTIRSSLGRRRRCGGDPAAVRESQRRQPDVRPRRVSVRRHGRRRLRRRSAQQRADAFAAAREDAPHRRERARAPSDGIRSCRPIRLRTAAASARVRRSGTSACAIRGASVSTIPPAAARARS